MSSAGNLFVHAIETCWCCSQIFELCRNFTGLIVEFYVVTSPCVLLRKQRHTTFVSIH